MIFKAEKKDISVIQDLAKKSWSFAYADILEQDQIDYMLDLMYSEETLNQHFENTNYHYYLIKENDKYLGFIGFEFHQELGTTKLHRIYFLKEAQGKGLGKKALDFIKEEVRKIGDKRVTLAVNKHNQAKSFYESQGFKVYDEGVFDIGNGYIMDDYLMEFIIK